MIEVHKVEFVWSIKPEKPILIVVAFLLIVLHVNRDVNAAVEKGEKNNETEDFKQSVKENTCSTT